MSIEYTQSKPWAKRLARAYENVTGQPTTIWRDGSAYRVQNDALNNYAAEAIASMLNSGERADRITAAAVETRMERLGMTTPTAPAYYCGLCGDLLVNGDALADEPGNCDKH